MSESMKTLTLKLEHTDYMILRAMSRWYLHDLEKKLNESSSKLSRVLYSGRIKMLKRFGANHLGWEDWPSFIQFCNTGKYPE